jgi:ATP:corrinoid adenosyltransferase
MPRSPQEKMMEPWSYTMPREFLNIKPWENVGRQQTYQNPNANTHTKAARRVLDYALSVLPTKSDTVVLDQFTQRIRMEFRAQPKP